MLIGSIKKILSCFVSSRLILFMAINNMKYQKYIFLVFLLIKLMVFCMIFSLMGVVFRIISLNNPIKNATIQLTKIIIGRIHPNTSLERSELLILESSIPSDLKEKSRVSNYLNIFSYSRKFYPFRIRRGRRFFQYVHEFEKQLFWSI